MVAPLLMLLLFGVIEFGLLFKDLLALNQCAREGARLAALGGTTTQVRNRIASAARTLRSNNIVIVLEYRTRSGGTWGSWTTLGNTGGTPARNNAPTGAQIRVRLTYPHQFATGGLLRCLFPTGDSGSVPVRTVMVARRE